MLGGWIGVDFDGTLAKDETTEPIPAMVERVKKWLALGIEVRILTARVATNNGERHLADEVAFLNKWTKQHLGQVLRVTAEKDYQMYQLWDDRAVQVVKDTGERVGQLNRASAKHAGRLCVDAETGYTR